MVRGYTAVSTFDQSLVKEFRKVSGFGFQNLCDVLIRSELVFLCTQNSQTERAAVNSFTQIMLGMLRCLFRVINKAAKPYP